MKIDDLRKNGKGFCLSVITSLLHLGLSGIALGAPDALRQPQMEEAAVRESYQVSIEQARVVPLAKRMVAHNSALIAALAHAAAAAPVPVPAAPAPMPEPDPMPMPEPDPIVYPDPEDPAGRLVP